MKWFHRLNQQYPRKKSRFKDTDIRVKFEMHIRYSSGDLRRPSHVKGQRRGKGQRNSMVEMFAWEVRID